MHERIPLTYLALMQQACPNKNYWLQSPVLKRLNTQLRSVRTIEELLLLFRDILNPEKRNDSDTQEYYAPITVNTQISTWVKELELIGSMHVTAVKKINTLKTVKPNCLLLDFLTKLLLDQQFLMHVNVASVLAVINKQEFSEIIDFIYQNPNSPKPETKSLGSFYALDPKEDKLLIEALRLFTNLAAQYDEKNTLFVSANGILQNGIIIYQDVISQPKFYDIPLSDTPPSGTEDNTDDKDGCILS